MFNKGTIILVPFPFTDLSGQKVRPAVILSSFVKGDDVIVAFVSSMKEKKRLEFDVPVSVSEKNGLKTDSIIKLSKIATLDKKIILGELGSLEKPICGEIDKKLKVLFKI